MNSVTCNGELTKERKENMSKSHLQKFTKQTLAFLLALSLALLQLPSPLAVQAAANYIAAEAKIAPVIDGRLDDDVWKTTFESYTDSSTGKTMQFKYAWDQNNLYVTGKYQDSTLNCNSSKIFAGDTGATSSSKYCWDYDSIGLYISPANSQGAFQGNDVQFMFTYQDDGSPALRVGSASGSNQKTNYDNGVYDIVNSACAQTTIGWDFEAAIPFSVLGIYSPASETFGIGMAQTDTNADLSKVISISDSAVKWNSFAGSNTLTIGSATVDYTKQKYASFVVNQNKRFDGIRVNPNITSTTDAFTMYTPKSGLSITPDYPATTSQVLVQVMQTNLSAGYTTTKAIGRVITNPKAGNGTFGTQIPANTFVLGGDGVKQTIIDSLKIGDMIEYIPAAGANAVDAYQLSDQTFNYSNSTSVTPYWATISTPANGSYTIPIDKLNDGSGTGKIAVAGPYGTYMLYFGNTGLEDGVNNSTPYSYRIAYNASGNIVYYAPWGSAKTTMENLNALGATGYLVIKLKATDTGVATYQPAPLKQGAFAQELMKIVGYSAIAGGTDAGEYTGVLAAAKKAGNFDGFSVTISNQSLAEIKLPNGGIGITSMNPAGDVPNQVTAANRTVVYSSVFGSSVTTPDSSSNILVLDKNGNVKQNIAAGNSKGTYSIPDGGYVIVSHMGSANYSAAFANTFTVGSSALVDTTSMQLTSIITKENLNAAADAAAALKQSDYTKDTWDKLQEQLVKAKAIIADSAATQSDLETAFAGLTKAIKELVNVEEARVAYNILDTKLTWSPPSGGELTKNTDGSITIKNLRIDAQNTVGWPGSNAMIPDNGFRIPLNVKPYLYVDVDTDEDATVNDWNISLSNGSKTVNLTKIFNEAAQSDAHGSQTVKIDLSDPNFADITSNGIIHIKSVTLHAVTEQYRSVTFKTAYISGMQQADDKNTYADPVKLPGGVTMKRTEIQDAPEYDINLNNNDVVKGQLDLQYTTRFAGQLHVKIDGTSIDGKSITKKPVLTAHTFGLNPATFPYASILTTNDGGTTWQPEGSFKESSTGSQSFWLAKPEEIQLKSEVKSGINEIRIVPSSTKDYFKLGTTPFGTDNLNDIQLKDIRLIMPNGTVYTPKNVNRYTPVSVGETTFHKVTDTSYTDTTAYALGDGYPAGSILNQSVTLGLEFDIDDKDLTPLYNSQLVSLDTTSIKDGQHELTLYFNNKAVKTIRFIVDNATEKLAVSPSYHITDSNYDISTSSYTLGLNVNTLLKEKLKVSFYQSRLFPVNGNITADNGTTAFSSVQKNALSTTGSSIMTDTASTLPSHEFEVNVGSYKGDVILSYNGTTKAGETIRFSVYNPVTSKWEPKVKLQDSIQNSFIVDSSTYASDGIIRAKADLAYVDNGSDTFMWYSDPQNVTDFEALNHFYSDVTQYAVSKYQNNEIGYFVNTGDIVNRNITSNWQIADAAQRILDDAGVPNGIVTGNHDVGNHTGPLGVYDSGDYENYWKYFGEKRYAHTDWFGGSMDNNVNHYDLVTIDGKDFIFLYLGMGREASEETVAWAKEVLTKYKDRNAVLSLHEYLTYSGANYIDVYGNGENVGTDVFNKIVVPNNNIVMVLCGHEPGAFTRVTNIEGTDRKVVEMLANYQVVNVSGSQKSTDNNYRSNGDGFVRLMTIDDNKLNFTTYSPSLDNANAFAPEIDTGSQELALQAPKRQLTTIDFTAVAAPDAPVKTTNHQADDTFISNTFDMDKAPSSAGTYAAIEDESGHITYTTALNWTIDAAQAITSKQAKIPDYLADYLNQTLETEITINLTKPDTLNKDVLKAMKENGKTLTINILDNKDKLSYQWVFDGKNITNTEIPVNLGVDINSPNKAKIEALTKQDKLFHLPFKHQGTLPGLAQVKVYVGNHYNEGERLYLYYYDSNKDRIELQEHMISVTDGFASFPLSHGLEYFLTAQKVSKPQDNNNPDEGGKHDDDSGNSDNTNKPGDSSKPNVKTSDDNQNHNFKNVKDDLRSDNTKHNDNPKNSKRFTYNSPHTGDKTQNILYTALAVTLAGMITFVTIRYKSSRKKHI